MMKQIVILLAVIYVASAVDAATTKLDNCLKAQGYQDYYNFLWDVARINNVLAAPMAQCLKEQLGGSAGTGIGDSALQALTFKSVDFRAFLKANTDLYGSSSQVTSSGGSSQAGFANYALCDLGTTEELTYNQVRHILRGMIYEFLACDLKWYTVGCTGINSASERTRRLS